MIERNTENICKCLQIYEIEFAAALKTLVLTKPGTDFGDEILLQTSEPPNNLALGLARGCLDSGLEHPGNGAGDGGLALSGLRVQSPHQRSDPTVQELLS